jgi:hypothetical protein
LPIWITESVWGVQVSLGNESDVLWKSDDGRWKEHAFISKSGRLHYPYAMDWSAWRTLSMSDISDITIQIRQSQEVIYGLIVGTSHEYRITFQSNAEPHKSYSCITDRQKAKSLADLIDAEYKQIKINQGASSVYFHFAFYEGIACLAGFYSLMVWFWKTTSKKCQRAFICQAVCCFFLVLIAFRCVFVIREVYLL